MNRTDKIIDGFILTNWMWNHLSICIQKNWNSTIDIMVIRDRHTVWGKYRPSLCRYHSRTVIVLSLRFHFYSKKSFRLIRLSLTPVFLIKMLGTWKLTYNIDVSGIVIISYRTSGKTLDIVIFINHYSDYFQAALFVLPIWLNPPRLH